MSDVSTRVKQVIADVLSKNISEVTPNAEIVADLGADSIDGAEIVMKLEEEFNVSAPSMENFIRETTVADAIVEVKKLI